MTERITNLWMTARDALEKVEGIASEPETAHRVAGIAHDLGKFLDSSGALLGQKARETLSGILGRLEELPPDLVSAGEIPPRINEIVNDLYYYGP